MKQQQPDKLKNLLKFTMVKLEKMIKKQGPGLARENF